jgi:hypothetical protein
MLRSGNGSTSNNVVVLFVDLDEWYHCRWATGALSSRWASTNDCFRDYYQGDQPIGEIREPTQWILGCLSNAQTKATFAILGEVAQWYPDLVKQIAQEGHEIACHGMHHRDITLASYEQFSEELARARGILEELSGRRVVGFRAPNLVITEWLPRVLVELGFVYDSSICPARIPRKFKQHSGAPASPYRVSPTSLATKGDANLIEIPISVFPFFNLSGGSSITTRILGWTWTRITLNSALQSGAACYYMHPYEFNSAPRLKNMSLQTRVFMRRTGPYMREVLHRLLSEYAGRIVTAEYYASHCFPQTTTMEAHAPAPVAQRRTS